MKTAGLHQLNNYNDLQALEAMKHKGRHEKEARLDAVAKQFESLFVSMMIKSMRDANKVFSEGNMLQSSETEFYQQMYDSQLSVTLSTGKGIGLAEVVKRQLAPSMGISIDGAGHERDRPAEFTMEGYQRKHFPSRELAERMVTALDKVEQTLAQKDNAPKPLDPVTSVDFSSPDAFIDSLYPYAKKVEQETGVDARLMLAQSALETGWGKHQIMNADGSSSHNLFGIKAHHDWDGDKAEILTTEYRQGVAMKERADFRAYPSYEDSFKDYANFLQSNQRYQPAFDHLHDPKAFAYALQDSGYATDPQYGEKISRILDRYLLDDTSTLSQGPGQSATVVR